MCVGFGAARLAQRRRAVAAVDKANPALCPEVRFKQNRGGAVGSLV